VPPNFDLQQFSGSLLAAISVVALTGMALWISLIIWAYRDMRARSRDIILQILAATVVAILNIPGLLVYMILRPRETLSEHYERTLEEEALLREIEDRQVCPGCTHEILDTWRICPYCHTRLKKQCANCEQLLDLPWSICPYCESPQAEPLGHNRRISPQDNQSETMA